VVPKLNCNIAKSPLNNAAIRLENGDPGGVQNSLHRFPAEEYHFENL
jgi:hypothetical protein